MTNLLSYLQFAHQHNVAQLKSECLAFFGRHSRQVNVTQEWKELITVQSDANQEILGLLIQTLLDTDNCSSVDTVLESETGAMASPQAFARPSSCQFFSKTIEIDNFQMKISKTDGKSVKVSSRDGSEQVCLYLWPSSRQMDKKETDNVVILLRTASHSKTRYTFPPNSMIKLDVSLINVKGEKHFTKCK